MATNKEYWMQRAILNDARTEAMKERSAANLNTAFEEAKKDIELRIEKFYRRYGTDGKVSAAEARKRLSATELADLRKEFAQLKKTATTEAEKKYLESVRQRIYLSRQEALLAGIRHSVTELAVKTDDTLAKNSEDIFTEQQMSQLYNIEQFVGFQVQFDQMSPTQLQTLVQQGYDGRSFSSKIWYDRDRLVKAVETILPRQFILGTSSQDLAKMLAKEMNTSYNNAVRLIRTEGTKMSAEADKNLYTQVGVAEYEYVATLDDSTTEWCRDMDGHTFPVSEGKVGINLPPLHGNCRSTTIPVVDMTGYEELRLAKDKDGKYIKVPKQSYREWETTRAA